MKSQSRFLSALRTRLNIQLALKLGTMVGLIGFLLALVYCLFFILRGYEVARTGYGMILTITALATVIVWVIRRKTIEHAAQFADQHWQLKDVLTTAYHFKKSGKSGRIYQLVQDQAAEHAKQLMGKNPPWDLPKKSGSLAVLLLLVSVGMLWVPASPEVLAQLAKQEMTAERTAEIQHELDEYLKKLEEELNDDEKETLKLNELKKWVKELKKTNNERDALKQFAKLEQKISKNMSALEQRKDEKILKNVAAQLMKAEMTEAKKLGKDLDLKEYKAAAKKLDAMKLSKAEKNKLKDTAKTTKLTEQQKKIAKMREISKRMAHANGKMGKPGQGKQGKMGKAGKMGKGEMGKMGEMAEGGDLEEMLNELDEALEELEEELEEMAMGDEEWDEDEMGAPMGRIDGDLDDLAKKLSKMGARRKARSKLKQMRQGLAQAQSYASGQSQQLNMGGKRAGEGTDPSKRNEKSKANDNGQFAQLSGIKNKGPSNSSIEEADSGTGVSRRRATAKERSYQRQFESFVHRDDIPEDLKSGVREYFKSIHQIPTVENPGSSTEP